MTHNFPLPINFIDTMHMFIFAVMEKKPTNYMQFAARYFGRLSNNQGIEGLTSSIESGTISDFSESYSLETIDSKQYANRRKSVAAEKFDPEGLNSYDLDVTTHAKSDEQKIHLKTVCENVAMFKSLNKKELMSIVDAMYAIDVKPNQEIIKEGDYGDNFYIIESGIYDAYITQNGEQTKIKSYENKGNFGELALIYNAPRAASVISQTDGVIWAVTRQVFRSVILVKAHKQREMYNKLLEQVPMLSPLDDFERANIADALTHKECEAGEIILKESDPGSQMFFIISGNVEIYKGSLDNKIVINTLGAGKYFGELALLSNQPRVASARATENTILAVLDVKTFERLMGPCIEIMKRNMDEYRKNVATLFCD